MSNNKNATGHAVESGIDVVVPTNIGQTSEKKAEKICETLYTIANEDQRSGKHTTNLLLFVPKVC